MSTSGLMWAAIAKPRRAFMPLEYRFTGVSMNSASSENAMMSSNLAVISLRVIPMMQPWRKMFSAPVRSW